MTASAATEQPKAARPQIIFTQSDESPALATAGLLGTMQAIFNAAGIDLVTKDISLRGRILASFPEFLREDQQVPNDLADMSERVQRADANVIKTPNVSATKAQTLAAIGELQGQGFAIPDYPENLRTDEEKSIRKRYDAVMGSAVNPVLRSGDAVRSIPGFVKEYASKNPHEMGEWSKDSRTRVAHMQGGDFYNTEESRVVSAAGAGNARIEFVGEDGSVQVLKDKIPLKESQIVDAATLSRAALKDFQKETIRQARDEDLPLSVHLKSTMMIKTDGVIFGDMVDTYFEDVFTKHAATLDALGFDPKNGLSDIDAGLKRLENKGGATPEIRAAAAALKADIDEHLKNHAPLAMVNAAKGITHLDAPNNVIVDVSMAKLNMWGGKQTDREGQSRDTIAAIPDTTYAKVHQSVIDFFRENGALDPATAGTVHTARLQTNGAEEYGSKDTTFNAPGKGVMRITDAQGEVLLRKPVEKGDIFRMCRTEDAGIENWVKIGLETARKTGTPAVFWLDENRAHDRAVAERVRTLLPQDSPVEIRIMNPEDAARYTLDRMARGLDTTAVTGNVLGDHITDLSPYLEVGTSTKMYSEVHLLSGGKVNETGSAGTAPDLVQGVLKENKFKFDDLGSFLALEKAAAHIAETTGDIKARTLAESLRKATELYVLEEKFPTAKNDIDTRESQFHFTKFVAGALAGQTQDESLKETFAPLARILTSLEPVILAEMAEKRGQTVDLGGTHAYDTKKVEAAMRPSPTLNNAVSAWSLDLAA